ARPARISRRLSTRSVAQGSIACSMPRSRPSAGAEALGRRRQCRRPFPTVTAMSNQPASERPVFVARFRALPDVDAIRSLRLMLKGALRLHGLQCLSLEEENDHATTTAQNSNDT